MSRIGIKLGKGRDGVVWLPLEVVRETQHLGVRMREHAWLVRTFTETYLTNMTTIKVVFKFLRKLC